MGEVQELLGFLSMETRADVRGTALELVLGITASQVINSMKHSSCRSQGSTFQEKEAFFASHTGFIPAIVTIFKVKLDLVLMTGLTSSRKSQSSQLFRTQLLRLSTLP